MRKPIALVLALICLLGLAGCKPDGTADLVELGEISAFISEKGHTEEELQERLVGEFNENVVHSWGEPDYWLSGFWGYGWYFDEDNRRYITLYFDANGYVEDIVIGNRSNEAVEAVLSDIAAEGIVSARFDSAIPNYNLGLPIGNQAGVQPKISLSLRTAHISPHMVQVPSTVGGALS